MTSALGRPAMSFSFEPLFRGLKKSRWKYRTYQEATAHQCDEAETKTIAISAGKRSQEPKFGAKK